MLKAIVFAAALALAASAPAIAQSPAKATLYELPPDGGNGPVDVLQGTVKWTINGTTSNGPEVEAIVSVPGRGELRVAFHKFVLPSMARDIFYRFKFGPLATGTFLEQNARFPSIIVRPKEGGVGYEVSRGGFAGIDLEGDRITDDLISPRFSNLGLLRDYHWIDLHILYFKSGQLALLTIEKDETAYAGFRSLLARFPAEPKFAEAKCMAVSTV